MLIYWRISFILEREQTWWFCGQSESAGGCYPPLQAACAPARSYVVYRQRRWRVAKVELPVRKKIRLEGHDYSSSGTYFVTICTTQRYVLLWDEGTIGLDEPTLSQIGKIIETAIQQIPTHYDAIGIDRYCVMRDHIHLLVIIHPTETVRCTSDPTAQETANAMLLKVIGSMKRWVSRQLGYSIWQKSFYEKIIRNNTEMDEVQHYIQNNPRKYTKYLLD